MKAKFLADEVLRRAVVLGVRRREPTISFVTSSDVGARGMDDAAVLKMAAQHGRIVVSHDVRTMPNHFRAFVEREAHPGLILVPQRLKLSTTIEDIVLLWLASEPAEWANRICFLPL